jgi:hypothetical protein
LLCIAFGPQRDAIRQKYGVHKKPKLSWGKHPNPSAYVDVVQGKDRDDAYNKDTLEHIMKKMPHPTPGQGR